MLLTVKQLSKSYGKHHVVKNVSFTLNNNSCIALIGPNGAGKTTILRMLTGLLNKSNGEITFHTQKTNDTRSLIGYLPQHPVFYSWMTGEEFLTYSGRLAHLHKKEAEERTDELLQKVGISDAKHKRISTYSGGMKQRLGIAQALIHRPPLIMLDEPVSALDPIGRREVLTLMEQLKKETTILFSTHILSDADEVSDELLLLHNGQLVESGSIKQLRKKYQTEKIELQFDGKLENYIENINKLPHTLASIIVRDTLHVTVSEVNAARNEIMKLVYENKWPLTSFNINQASLEQMFMKVVND